VSLLSDIRRVFELLRPERKRYAAGLASLFVLNASDVAAPLFLALAVELTKAELSGVAAEAPPPLMLVGLDAAAFTLMMSIAAYLGLQFIANALRYPMLMWTAVPSHQIGQTVRRSISSRLLSQSQSFYDQAKSGDLMSIATADVHAIRMMLGPGILVGADTVMLSTLVLAVMFALSWKLALVALIPLPLIYLVTNKLSHLEYEGFEAVQEDLSEMTERVRESYAGIRIIQGFARESFDRGRFEDFSLRHYAKNLVLARVRAAFDPTLDFMLGLSTVLVLVFGGIWVASGQIGVGTFVAFLFLIRYLSGPMIGLGWSISLFQRGRASLGRVRRLLDEPIEVTDAPDAIDVAEAGRISIRGLTFGYGDDEPVLSDVDLEIPAGTTLGVFGPVGSGKTTLARLLTRMYEPPRGTVFLDGVDVRDISLDSLRRQIVLAPQETFLFSNTVERNLTLVRKNTMVRNNVERDLVDEREQIIEFAKLAKLHGEVEEFSQGYETMLGERGVNLSGGQRQRLAIARAIAADPQILVLDDCLSAVDANTEHVILENLRRVFAGRSGIIISHRVRAVRDCDAIVVLEDGGAADYGTHDELMARQGYYQMIAREQLAIEDDEDARVEEPAL
jgi:ATP-binding cassette subfamily B protein